MKDTMAELIRDEAPHELRAPRGPLLTLREASVLLDRPLRLVRQWAQDGTLPSRFEQTEWPYGKLVTYDDLLVVAGRRRTGRRKGSGLLTLDGKPYKPTDQG